MRRLGTLKPAARARAGILTTRGSVLSRALRDRTSVRRACLAQEVRLLALQVLQRIRQLAQLLGLVRVSDAATIVQLVRGLLHRIIAVGSYGLHMLGAQDSWLELRSDQAALLTRRSRTRLVLDTDLVLHGARTEHLAARGAHRILVAIFH